MPKVSSSDLSHRRREILEGARRCFAEFGYDGATVRRLEQATGKSRGAIFHHFADKENLFLALAREDAARMADVVAAEGLVEVMRDMLAHQDRYDWLSTRLEITRLLRTDRVFSARWVEHQAVLDEAIRSRLQAGVDAGRMRTDVPVEVLHTYLVTVMDGFITHLASGEPTDCLHQVLDLVEASVRTQSPASL
ncbi:TetR/AcrR family transcriptional regulator [Corynebacterium sp. CCM 8835]|uniref:HTH-type transcriptional repressor AcnR n=1 Tax=Corynebacterium antarcticum TaxID=2800405 RepID=A0A9Q4CA74_9CORY|nr:TetR/AcrR family transcriptional regulator [Corynebacterium antarcticum]MCK7641439.1 TetR/AcrR family transcriptional regulator [Corynebacterium antarcticum]MCK7660460.1 TetR/AcrR family transcriptional regulator [Corynebacterium antarcticum]MCL0244670.1 TetR/AcrR family transcriptional regulator [Corynebacterium antarcticum]MCX7491040.1 TetR/AcrR family transcriptional regulator [Corynebacterium antarcticum]MCX7537066.1 TetR/AcrR family transcriptional regulator [Corynebacterium antarcticu